MKTVEFMSLQIVDSNLRSVLSEVFKFLDSGTGQKYIVTPNPEMLVEANKNQKFQTVLQKAWLCFPDGFGIIFYSNFLTGIKIKNRITGVDFVTKFLTENKNYRVFLIGGAYGAAKSVKAKFSCVVDYYDGLVENQTEEYLLERIENSGAEIVLVALGAPKQELWISENIEALSNIRLAIGIGGTLDFIAGIQIRAPYLFRKFGLEWMWRLFTQPKRFCRIFNATIVFTFLVFKKKLSSLFS